MKTNENYNKVLESISNNPKSTVESIEKSTKVFKLQIFKILKKLGEDEKIMTETEGSEVVYSAIDLDAKASLKQSKKNKKQEAIIEEVREYGKIEFTGRNTNKLKFQGQEYGKGKLVLAVIQSYLESNPRTTVSQLKEVFKDELQPAYGVCQELSKAKKMSETRERFFLKSDQILKVGEKKTAICICNQWGSHNLGGFLKVAKSLGYSIR